VREVFMREGCIVVPFAYKSPCLKAFSHLLDCIIEGKNFAGIRLHPRIRSKKWQPLLYIGNRKRMLILRGNRKYKLVIRPCYLIVPIGGLMTEEVFRYEQVIKISGKRPSKVYTIIKSTIKRDANLQHMEMPLAQRLGWPLYKKQLIRSFTLPQK
jgi:hypothetical protein